MPDHMEGLLNELDNADITKVLKSYQQESPLKANMSAMEKANRVDTLNITVDYLKTFKDTYPSAVKKFNQVTYNRTKAHITFEICNFLSEISPAVCMKCKTAYMPCEQRDPATDIICCIICDKTAHQGCFTNESLDVENGVTYMCTECLKAVKATRMETIRLVNSAQIQEETLQTGKTEKPSDTQRERKSESSSESSNEESEFDEHRTKKKEKREPQKPNNICKLYKIGECPHGRWGKECEYEHPRQCRRWCSFADSKWGCKYGDSCYYFHPAIVGIV